MASGFFSSNIHKSTALLNLGGSQFQALAVVFIDQFKQHPAMYEPCIKSLITPIFDRYQDSFTAPSHASASEKLSRLIDTVRTSELVEALSQVLKKYALEEIRANPTLYPEVFEGLTADTQDDYVLQPTTILHQRALQALTNRLGLTIILSRLEPGKELRSREIYENSRLLGPQMALKLQVQGDAYFPEVYDKNLFAYVGLMPTKQGTMDVTDQDNPSMADCFAKLDAAFKDIATHYKKTHQKLATMLQLGELNAKHLLDSFVKFFPAEQTSLPPGAAFLSKLRQLDRGPLKLLVAKEINQQELLLLDALSGWVSTKQIPEDDFWLHVEEHCLVSRDPPEVPVNNFAPRG